MAHYRPVDTRLWNDRKFRALSDDGKLLWVFLLTCSQIPIPGVIVGGNASLAEHIGWLPQRIREGFADLSANGMGVSIDGRLVWLKNALRYQPPSGPNTVRCWSKSWDDIPDCDLKYDLWKALKSACKSWDILFSQGFAEPSKHGSHEPSTEPSMEPSPNHTSMVHTQEQEQEQEQREREIRTRAVPTGPSGWAARQSWWVAMLEADLRIKAAGIEPSAPSLPKTCAGEHEKNVNACATQLAELGYSPDEVDAKMRHIVLVSEAIAIHREKSRRYFKPSIIWDPPHALRDADTSIAEARKPPRAKGDPIPSTPTPRRKPDPPLIAIPADEREDVAAMAAELRDRLIGRSSVAK